METRKFWLVGALTTLLACGADGEPATQGDVGDGPSTRVDAATLNDAARPPREGAAEPSRGGATDAGGAQDAGRPSDASALDAGSFGDAGDAPGGDEQLDAGSPTCTVSAASASCLTRSIVKLGVASDVRRVYWNLPTSAAPAAGYPVVVLYQGTGVGPALSWNTPIAASTAFGGYYQVALIAELLVRGYAVVQPEASGGGFWSTNVGGSYDSSLDGVFIPLLLAALRDGSFGKLDEGRLYATGISSGGYMTSRMAVSHAGYFRALAIQSGSYATCLGPLCNIPAQLPEDHPPTLLLHGALDTTVPVATARNYETKLRSNGIEVKLVQDAEAGHQWLRSAPDEVCAWFDAH